MCKHIYWGRINSVNVHKAAEIGEKQIKDFQDNLPRKKVQNQEGKPGGFGKKEKSGKSG